MINPEILDDDLEVELHDVFHVMQVTRDTPLASEVAADLVDVMPGQESSMHRHNLAETVLYFLDGAGEVLLGADYEAVAVKAGDRLRIGKGVFHAVRTGASTLRFLSVQAPPILDVEAGTRDLEPIEAS
ncbi:MAG: cupin domain-containing protein [Ilumatobacter sp.]|nr:cupin domain-containing protein [Ilumatobacter sp.]